MTNKSTWNWDSNNVKNAASMTKIEVENDISNWNLMPLKRTLARGIIRRLSNIEKGKPTTPYFNHTPSK